MKPSIELLLEAYQINYSTLYNSEAPTPHELIDEGQRFIDENLPFIRRLARYRGDGFVSDREVAAIGMTFGG